MITTTTRIINGTITNDFEGGEQVKLLGEGSTTSCTYYSYAMMNEI
jgi:hypothetical protein